MRSTESRHPLATFLALCAAFAALATLLIVWSATRERPPSDASVESWGLLAEPASRNQSSVAERIYFRHTDVGSNYGTLAYVDYARPKDRLFVESLSCEAIHASGGRGLCLTADRGVVTTYAAQLFTTTAHDVTGEIALGGVPSRTRVSRDGALGATTVFVTGHGYDTVGFSTQTLLIDMRAAQVIADLETFSVYQGGEFNFWGVTFTPDARNFYATLSTEERHYLVRGDIGARSVTVIHENVECPSLSPDATRVAYKKRYLDGGRVYWQLHVLDLATREETSLAERRSVDDQLEWLDNDRVLYSVRSQAAGAGTDVWVANADGSGTPAIFLNLAYSPAVAL